MCFEGFYPTGFSSPHFYLIFDLEMLFLEIVFEYTRWFADLRVETREGVRVLWNVPGVLEEHQLLYPMVGGYGSTEPRIWSRLFGQTFFSLSLLSHIPWTWG